MGSLLIVAIAYFARILTFLMFLQAVMSWFIRDMNSPAGQIYSICSRITAPIVDPVRSFMRRFNTGPIDFTLVVAIILVDTVAWALIKLVSIIF